MATTRSNTRERILTAAAAVARESGPGSLSLDAVAARAGVSKGGLLYNFPTKAKLLQSLVEAHVAEFDQALEAGVAGGESLVQSFVRLSAEACEQDEAPAAWIFSAIAEDPEFLAPVTVHRRRLLARLMEETSDPSRLLVIFLAIEGMRSLKLFDAEILSEEQRRQVVERVLRIARQTTPEAAA